MLVWRLTCIAVKWFILEIHSEAAWRLHHPDYQLHVPGLLLLDLAMWSIKNSGVEKLVR